MIARGRALAAMSRANALASSDAMSRHVVSKLERGASIWDDMGRETVLPDVARSEENSTLAGINVSLGQRSEGGLP